jgi:hypothetical protein
VGGVGAAGVKANIGGRGRGWLVLSGAMGRDKATNVGWCRGSRPLARPR